MYMLHVLSPKASYVCHELFLARLIIESLNNVTVHNYTRDQRAEEQNGSLNVLARAHLLVRQIII